MNTGSNTWPGDRLSALARAGIVDAAVALSILAHWALETDRGRAEWNWNVGNIRPVGNEPRIELGTAGAFRAYANLDEGVGAYLALLHSGRYTPCWGMLNADPESADWIRCLVRQGYFGDADAEVTARAWSSRRAELAGHVSGVGSRAFFDFVRALS